MISSFWSSFDQRTSQTEWPLHPFSSSSLTATLQSVACIYGSSAYSWGHNLLAWPCASGLPSVSPLVIEPSRQTRADLSTLISVSFIEEYLIKTGYADVHLTLPAHLTTRRRRCCVSLDSIECNKSMPEIWLRGCCEEIERLCAGHKRRWAALGGVKVLGGLRSGLFCGPGDTCSNGIILLVFRGFLAWILAFANQIIYYNWNFRFNICTA